MSPYLSRSSTKSEADAQRLCMSLAIFAIRARVIGSQERSLAIFEDLIASISAFPGTPFSRSAERTRGTRAVPRSYLIGLLFVRTVYISAAKRWTHLMKPCSTCRLRMLRSIGRVLDSISLPRPWG